MPIAQGELVQVVKSEWDMHAPEKTAYSVSKGNLAIDEKGQSPVYEGRCADGLDVTARKFGAIV